MMDYLEFIAHNVFQNIGPMLFYLCFFSALFMVACGVEWLWFRWHERHMHRPSMRDWK